VQNRLLIGLLVLVAACSGPTGPKYKDPFAMVHVDNQTSTRITTFAIVSGSDGNHSFVASFADDCQFSASVPFERTFVYVAAVPGSTLSKWLYDMGNATPAAQAFADSLGLRQVDFSAALNKAGLVSFTVPSDLAPVGYAPTDTVRWHWTITSAASTLVVDPTDGTCR
jgi:hypothetical protein